MQNLKHIKKQIQDLELHSNYLEKQLIQQSIKFELKYSYLEQELKKLQGVDKCQNK